VRKVELVAVALDADQVRKQNQIDVLQQSIDLRPVPG
jgi:hypothetical protein